MGTINAEVQYRPSNGVIVEIISSGKLELFEYDSLRFLISGWEGELQKVRFQEKDELEVQRIKLFNMANKHVNFREMARGYRQNIFELDRSDFKSSEKLVDSTEAMIPYNSALSKLGNEIVLDSLETNAIKGIRSLKKNNSIKFFDRFATMTLSGYYNLNKVVII